MEFNNIFRSAKALLFLLVLGRVFKNVVLENEAVLFKKI